VCCVTVGGLSCRDPVYLAPVTKTARHDAPFGIIPVPPFPNGLIQSYVNAVVQFQTAPWLMWAYLSRWSFPGTWTSPPATTAAAPAPAESPSLAPAPAESSAPEQESPAAVLSAPQQDSAAAEPEPVVAESAEGAEDAEDTAPSLEGDEKPPPTTKPVRAGKAPAKTTAKAPAKTTARTPTKTVATATPAEPARPRSAKARAAAANPPAKAASGRRRNRKGSDPTEGRPASDPASD
jgi:hypothetical protein